MRYTLFTISKSAFFLSFISLIFINCKETKITFLDYTPNVNIEIQNITSGLKKIDTVISHSEYEIKAYIENNDAITYDSLILEFRSNTPGVKIVENSQQVKLRLKSSTEIHLNFSVDTIKTSEINLEIELCGRKSKLKHICTSNKLLTWKRDSIDELIRDFSKDTSISLHGFKISSKTGENKIDSVRKATIYIVRTKFKPSEEFIDFEMSIQSPQMLSNCIICLLPISDVNDFNIIVEEEKINAGCCKSYNFSVQKRGDNPKCRLEVREKSTNILIESSIINLSNNN